jgi:folate-binding Fe-S cluster repair protein YgfZ
MEYGQALEGNDDDNWLQQFLTHHLHPSSRIGHVHSLYEVSHGYSTSVECRDDDVIIV